MNETEYHNPANLTPEQIGEGYELLTVEENAALAKSTKPKEGLEWWCPRARQWIPQAVGGNNSETYRRRKKPGLTIEPGKHYRMRDGRKYICYANYGEVVHGAYFVSSDNVWVVVCHKSDGRLLGHAITAHDLIAPWVDAPEVNWSKLPAFIKCVTVDASGEAWAWACSETHVVMFETEWLHYNYRSNKFGYRLFPGTVKFTGDWRQSKVCRPEVAK